MPFDGGTSGRDFSWKRWIFLENKRVLLKGVHCLAVKQPSVSSLCVVIFFRTISTAINCCLYPMPFVFFIAVVDMVSTETHLSGIHSQTLLCTLGKRPFDLKKHPENPSNICKIPLLLKNLVHFFKCSLAKIDGSYGRI